MGEEQAKKESHATRWALWSAALLVAVPLFYMLSVGPVQAWALRARWSPHTWYQVQCFYAPLRELEPLHAVSDPLWDYIRWCNRACPGSPDNYNGARWMQEPFFRPY